MERHCRRRIVSPVIPSNRSDCPSAQIWDSQNNYGKWVATPLEKLAAWTGRLAKSKGSEKARILTLVCETAGRGLLGGDSYCGDIPLTATAVDPMTIQHVKLP
uniref:Uncharacterized protein n=1 Tax=Echinococcus granulosus TaxID=6210 RepID=A0A068WFI1_ECHGR|nr:hypothetical protein EgrG_002019400 [Echinococcus granulosus]